MSDALEKLQRKLEAAHRALAEAEARYVRQEAVHQTAIKEAENTRKLIEQAHQEWMSALNAVETPIFVHDKDFRVLRCNLAYRRSAGVPLKQIIGQPYYKVFPKTHAPLHKDLQASEEEKEEDVLVGNTTYRSRVYSVKDGRGNYLYSVHTLENINESTRISKALRESEIKYRQLFEAAQDGILILDAETGKIIDANPFILDLLSYSLDEYLGKMLWEIGLFEDIESSKAAFLELQTIGYIRYEDLPLKTKDGRQIDVEFVSNLYKVGEQKVIQCNIHDITNRIRAMQALRASEMQYRQMFETAPDGILILDAETGKIIDANPFILNLLSYSLDEYVGKMLWEIGLFKDIKASKEAFDELQSIGYIRYEDLPLKTKDGRRIEVEFVSNLYEIGERKVIQCNIRDITERKANETNLKIFRALLDKSNDAIEVLDPTTLGFIDVNDTACRALGYSRDELLSMNIHDIDPEASKMPMEKMEETLQTHGSIVFESIHRRKDGTTFPVEVSISRVRIEREYLIAMVRDITERKATQQQLQLNAQLLDSTADSIMAFDLDGFIIYLNEATWKARGYTHDEMMGMNLRDFDTPEFRKNVAARFKGLIQKGSTIFEAAHQRKDGSSFPIEVNARFVEVEGSKLILASARDITERKQAAQAVYESEERLRSITTSAQDAIIMIDNDGKISFWNPAAEKIFGYPPQEALGQQLHDLVAPERFHDHALQAFSHFRKNGEGPLVGKTIELYGKRKDDTEFPLDLSLSSVKQNGLWGAIGIIRDITERKRAETELKASEERFRAIFDHARDGILVMNIDMQSIRFANKSMERMLGYESGELIGLTLPQLHPPEMLAQAKEQFERDASSEQNIVQDMPMLTKDGRVLYVDLSGSPVEFGGHRYLLGAFRDATERRASELSLRRANRALQTLSLGNMALVQAQNEDDLLQAITRVIVEQGGYAQAVVDYAENDSGKSIIPKAWSGYKSDHYWAESVSWADTEQGQLPIAKAIRSGKTQVSHDIASNSSFRPWVDSIVEYGYVSNIALPMSDGKRVFGGLSIYSSEANAFDDEEVRLLEELANDLAYGIVTMRARKQNEEHEAVLRQGLEQSIQTIAATVEARDPYTAGHQRRVGELATAIGQEMGLPEDQINGIHLAAIIHDLGKIHVPAEILSKPGKLTDIEYMLIKEHPQYGYDILKDVKFPWPIADIILQHHEKLDGSGYPQGLKGEQILLESRILTVADVVEAMSSHRPYRRALGIKLALEEIRRGRGSEYDPGAVDACIKLFSKKKFAFSSQEF